MVPILAPQLILAIIDFDMGYPNKYNKLCSHEANNVYIYSVIHFMIDTFNVIAMCP